MLPMSVTIPLWTRPRMVGSCVFHQIMKPGVELQSGAGNTVVRERFKSSQRIRRVMTVQCSSCSPPNTFLRKETKSTSVFVPFISVAFAINHRTFTPPQELVGKLPDSSRTTRVNEGTNQHRLVNMAHAHLLSRKSLRVVKFTVAIIVAPQSRLSIHTFV